MNLDREHIVEKSHICLFIKVIKKIKCVVSRDLGEEYEWIIYVAGLISFLRPAKNPNQITLITQYLSEQRRYDMNS